MAVVLKYLSLLVLTVQVPAFNLDLMSTVILNGTNGTNFGYSVALWYHAPEKYQRLAVGSPLSSDSHRGEGAVSFCHPHTGHCIPDPLATRSLQGHDTHVLAGIDENLRADMGFGETLAAFPSSPHLLACAPRYPFHQSAEKKYEGIFPRGACVRLGPDSPLPLVPVTELYSLSLSAEGRPVKRINSIQGTGFSEAGFSAVVTQNDQYYIGGPMAFYGQGTAFWKSDAEYDLLKRQINKNIHKDFSLGFWAVAAAKLDGSNEYLAVTAPNDLEARGSVSIYIATRTGLSVRRPRSGVSLVGVETGGMYGYSVTAGDWDGDGVADLAVGAPYIGGDSGSVNIVYGPMMDAVERPGQWLRGEVSSAHLGLALAGAGDLDRDGRDDLAVAAPDDDHGKVFIFNGGPDGLHATPSQVLSGRDVLRPVPLRPARFGFSLSGGQDIDDNGCLDLLVGAVGADQAVYVRTAPVLTLVGKLEFQPSVVALRSRLCNSTSPTGATESFTCFELKATLQYNSSVYLDRVDVELRLSVDERYPFLRCLFWSNNERREQTSLQLAHVTEPPRYYTTLVYIKSERPSLQELVRAQVNISLSGGGAGARGAGREGAPPPPGPVPPILHSTMLEASTRLTCQDEDSCFSHADLQLTVEYSPLRIGGGRQSVAVEVRVEKAQAHQVSLKVHVPSMLSFSHAVGSSMLPSCSHAADEGHSFVQLTCSLAAAISKDTTVGFTLYFDHSPLALLGAVEEGLVETLPLFFSVQGDTDDLNPADNHAHVQLELVLQRDVLATGMSQPEQVRVLVNETLSLETVLAISAASNNYSLDQLGPEAAHTFTFSNRGPAPLLHDQIIVEWPRSTLAMGNWSLPLLYITDQVFTSGSVVCRPLLPNDLNFTGLFETPDETLDSRYLGDGELYFYNTSDGLNTSESLHREERSTGSELGGAWTSSSVHQTVPSINCDNVECFIINCTVSGLLAGDVVQVVVRSRVAVAALNKKLRNFMLTSRARLLSSGEELEVTTYVTLIPPPQGTLDLLSGRWWLPSAGLLLGLLVLLLLAVGLYKCGFFRREKRRHLQELRASQRRRPSQGQPLTKQQEQEQQQLYVQEALLQGEVEDLSDL